MTDDGMPTAAAPATIAPWLSVADATAAVAFYMAAFGATEMERMEGEPGRVIIAQLSIAGAEVWVQEDEAGSPQEVPSPVRMILTVADPDAMFAQAIGAGGTAVAGMHESHGWRIGRLVDVAGHHWEVGRRLTG